MSTTIQGLPITITVPGTYVLDADLTTAADGITVQCDGVTIDLQGHTLASSNSDPNNQFCGVSANGYSNVTVQNGTITGFAYGVHLADPDPAYVGTGGHVVQNLTIHNCTYRGIEVEGSGNVVSHNDVSHIGGATFIADAYGMGIEMYGANGLVSYNTVADVRGRGGSDVGEGVGICLSQETYGSTVIGNTITQPSAEMDSAYASWPAESRSCYGIFVGGNPTDVTVSGNNVANYFYGITFARGAAGNYSDNDVTHSFIAYYLPSNTGSRVVDDGGNLSDLDPSSFTYGRFTTGAVETVEADYLSPMERIPGHDQFLPIRNSTPGDDIIAGTSSRDLVDYWLSFYFLSTGVVVDLEAGIAKGWGGNDTLIGIEGVKGTINDDLLSGSNDVNLLNGAEGNDALYGRGGDDFLFGGAGNDFLYGGIGADALNGGAGTDLARYDDSDYAGLTVSLQTLSLNTGAAAGDTFIDIEGIAGGIGNDFLYGDAGNNLLLGGYGNDMLFGSLGADALDGGAGIDYAQFTDAGYDGLTADLANIIAGTGAAAGDVYTDIEGLILTRNDDVGYGDSQVNWLYGMEGNDALYGRGGNDFLFGGVGNDFLYGGFGADALDGGAGTDLARYDDADYGDLTVSLQAPSINTGAAAGDTFVDIEGIVGGTGSDFLYGDAGDNLLFGGDGNDRLFGSLGADTLDGGTGIDYAQFTDAGYAGLTADLANIVVGTGAAAGDIYLNIEGLVLTRNDDIGYGDDQANWLYGMEGDDALYGRDGDDFLCGGIGNDTLSGGVGDDCLVGGAGSDAFTVSLNANGHDTIVDFEGGYGLRDVLDFRGVFATFSDVLDASRQTGNNLVIEFAGGTIELNDFYLGNLAFDDVLLV